MLSTIFLTAIITAGICWFISVINKDIKNHRELNELREADRRYDERQILVDRIKHELVTEFNLKKKEKKHVPTR